MVTETEEKPEPRREVHPVCSGCGRPVAAPGELCQSCKDKKAG